MKRRYFIFLLMLPAVYSFSQTTSPENPVLIQTLLEFHEMGGVFIYPLYMLSIIGTAFILERAFSYRFQMKMVDPALVKASKEWKGIKEIKELAEQKKTHMGIIVNEIFRLSKKRKSVQELDKVLEMSLNMRLSELQKGFTIISAVINIAPLIGFLGTVSGMINAFKTISETDQVSITLVAKGIYEALVTTEVGLIIAIIMNLFYSLFVQRIERFTQLSVEVGENLIERIAEGED